MTKDVEAAGELVHIPNERNITATEFGAPNVDLLGWKQYRARFEGKGATFLIRDLVRLGTLISINGRPGAGKTSLVLEIVRSLDGAEAFLGRDTKRCATCYVATEDQDDIANRLQALALDDVMIVVAEDGVPLNRPEIAIAVIREAIRRARRKFPDREIFIPIDTLRAGLDGASVLDDRFTSPVLNRLRRLAEEERVVIAIVNHTNRENPKQTKGETLESVVALELTLVDGEGDWFAIHVGKNRSGPSRQQVGRVRFGSVQIGEVSAAVVDHIETVDDQGDAEKSRKPGGNQALILSIMRNAFLDHRSIPFRPFRDGPEVQAVKEKIVRDTFIERKAGEDRETKRRGFNAALNAMVNKTLMRGENPEGEGLIWFARKADEAGKGISFPADPGEG